MTSAGGMTETGRLVTYPLSPASFLARARALSSRAGVPPAFLTNRGVRADFAPLMTSRARFSCAVRVLLSRANRFAENAQTARQDFGWSFRSQAGSARRAGALSLFLPFFGVRVSMTCPSVNASPC